MVELTPYVTILMLVTNKFTGHHSWWRGFSKFDFRFEFLSLLMLNTIQGVFLVECFLRYKPV